MQSGLFFGIFILDAAHSVQLAAKLKRFAADNNVIVRYEALKAEIHSHHMATAQKYHFFSPFHTDRQLAEHLKDMLDTFERRIKKN